MARAPPPGSQEILGSKRWTTRSVKIKAEGSASEEENKDSIGRHHQSRVLWDNNNKDSMRRERQAFNIGTSWKRRRASFGCFVLARRSCLFGGRDGVMESPHTFLVTTSVVVRVILVAHGLVLASTWRLLPKVSAVMSAMGKDWAACLYIEGG